ncbi:MAG: hypothetical protein LBB82_06725 [Treponema sp.]|jgi:hypothetical protein|nr:hypothetical protein [Treponema sp.]
MDDMASWLVYLIPIALVISVRILNAGARQKNRERQKASNDELVEKINEARRNPAYADALTGDTGVYLPPAAPLFKTQNAASSPFSEKPVVWPSTPRPAAKKKSVPKKPPAAAKTRGAYEIQPDTTAAAPAETAPLPASESVQPIAGLARLTPLQQALVWSEVLGAPRGM